MRRELAPLEIRVIAEQPEADAWRETCFAACALLRRAAEESEKRFRGKPDAVPQLVSDTGSIP